MSSSSRSKRKCESDATPEEVVMRCEKLTDTYLDELGVDLETQLDGSLKIVSSPQEACQVDQWNRRNPNNRIERGDAIICVNGIRTDQSERMLEIIETDTKLTLTVRLASKVRLSKLNEIAANYKTNHSRKPDLSADIRIRFPDEEYIGTYVNHGGSKTVFIIRRSGFTKGRYDGKLLKIRSRTPDCPWDKEPEIARAAKRAGHNILPEISWEGIGVDGYDEYHCWVIERCIPLDQLAELSTCDKEQCVLAACRGIAQGALCRIHLSDCHFYNWGLRITPKSRKKKGRIY